METSGFERYTTEQLKTVHANLLKGLDAVAETIDNGTFNEPPDTKGATPPSQFGQLFLMLLKPVVAELKTRPEFLEELRAEGAERERRRNGR